VLFSNGKDVLEFTLGSMVSINQNQPAGIKSNLTKGNCIINETLRNRIARVVLL